MTVACDTEGLIVLETRQFQFLATFLSSHTGIILPETKREMVRARLIKRLRALGLESFKEYCELIERSPERELEHIVNAITTNITEFFREPHHFDFLASELKRRPPGRLRIWSAACSSGEEPYSIAMTLRNTLSQVQLRDTLVLATDIDTNMLYRAGQGIYPSRADAKIPAALRNRFLRPDTDSFTMAEEIRALVRFRRLNLLENWPMRGLFDFIFCRNVVIYFDKLTQRTLFDRLADMLMPNGILFLGHAETLIGVSERFEPVAKTVYRRLS